ncbi:MAG: STAS domain-containing protein [Gemmataceae bacterium]
MSEETPSLVTSAVLILRISEPQIMGDTLADALRDQFLALVDQSGAQHVVVDMNVVKYISSAGIRPLLTLNKKVRERGGRLILCCLSPEVESVFSATRLITTSTTPRSIPATFESHTDVLSSVASLYPR